MFPSIEVSGKRSRYSVPPMELPKKLIHFAVYVGKKRWTALAKRMTAATVNRPSGLMSFKFRRISAAVLSLISSDAISSASRSSVFLPSTVFFGKASRNFFRKKVLMASMSMSSIVASGTTASSASKVPQSSIMALSSMLSKIFRLSDPCFIQMMPLLS